MIEVVAMEDLGRDGLAVPENDDKPQGIVELDTVKEDIGSPEKHLRCLAVVKARLEMRGGLFDACQKAIFECHRGLRLLEQQK